MLTARLVPRERVTENALIVYTYLLVRWAKRCKPGQPHALNR